jgi:carbohydrate diacid regulator
MLLDMKLANEIMHEINSVVPNYCSIMDNQGKILVCTDSTRVGNFHDGIRDILEQNLNELIVERDGQYPGVLKGVVVPIHFTEEDIGFFGIAGDADEVLNFARIIPKMIRMIVYEKLDVYYQERNAKAKRNLVEALIKGDVGDNGLFSLEDMMTQYGLSKIGPFTVAVISGISGNSDYDTELARIKKNIIINNLIGQLEKTNLLAATVSGKCIVVSNLSAQHLYMVLDKIVKNVKSRMGMSLLCSIGGTIKNHEEISKSYNEALGMVQFNERLDDGKAGIFFYDPTNMDFMVYNIPKSHRENIKEKIFGKCDKREAEKLGKFIRIYFCCNGSLNKISQQCFVHKNTVQYKIQKIYAKTGLDPRNFNDLFLLYIASIG